MTMPIPANNRVKELEEVLEGYQRHNTELESQLEQVTELHRQTAARRLKVNEYQVFQAYSRPDLIED